MFTHEMFIHKVIINALKLRIDAAGDPRHSRHFLHHHRVMHGIVSVFSPREWTVLIHHNTRRMQRLTLSQRVDNDATGVEFILPFHFGLR